MLISIFRTLILYFFIMLAIRLMGKRQISDMQPSELVVTMVISDIASLPMQNTSQPLLSGIIPVLILVSLEIATSVVMMKSRKFRKLICGSAVVIIKDGKLLQSEMKRLRLILKQYPDIRFGVYNSSTKQEDAEGIAKLLKDCMESAAELKVKLIAEENIADNWYDLK